MALLPTIPSDPTTTKVKVHIEESQVQKPRTYMGMSGMGDPCERRIWLRFRHAVSEKHSAETLCNFEDGYRTEELMIKRLKDAGFTVTDRINGRQVAFHDFGGHFRGNADGIINGLPNAPKKNHILEVKATNEKSFRTFVRYIETLGEKASLFAWKPEYYAQAQLYMHYYGTDRHYIMVATPGGRDFMGARTEYDAGMALRYKTLAERLIFTDIAPEPYPESHWLCRMCGVAEQCRGHKAIPRNCRNCMHVEVKRDGTWHCTKHNEEAITLCESHRYLPSLVPGKVDGLEGENVRYVLNSGGEWVDDGK